MVVRRGKSFLQSTLAYEGLTDRQCRCALQFGPRTSAGGLLSEGQATQPLKSSTSHLTSTESVRQVSALPTGAETPMTTVIYSIPRCNAPKAWSIGMWWPKSIRTLSRITPMSFQILFLQPPVYLSFSISSKASTLV